MYARCFSENEKHTLTRIGMFGSQSFLGDYYCMRWHARGYFRGGPHAGAHQLCRRLKIDVLVVTSGDPVWNIPDSWVWKRYPLISNGDARAFLMKTPVFAEKR